MTQRQPEGAVLSKKQQIARPGVSAKDRVWRAICLLKISVLLQGREVHFSACAGAAEMTLAASTMHRPVREKKLPWCLPSTQGHLSEVMAGKGDQAGRS